MSYSVYKHTFPNGKMYIGITSQKPERRWANGKGYLNKNNNYEYTQPHMARAILKYGWDNIKHEVIFNGLTKAEAEQIEIKLISQYQSNNYKYGYNVANGGSLAGVHSEETKKKIGKAFKGKHLSKEHKEKISKANKGRKLSEEHAKKLSKSLRGRKLSEEHKEKVVEAIKKRKRSKETKQKVSKPVKCIETNAIYSSMREAEATTGIDYRYISAVCRGINKTAGGCHWEYINKKMRLVRCVETNKIYDSITSASKETGINHGNISNVCNGKRETTGGYHWEFVEKDVEDIENERTEPIVLNAQRYKIKKVKCIEKDTVYESMTKAEKETGVSLKRISACCNGRNKTAGGYHWEFVENDVKEGN